LGLANDSGNCYQISIIIETADAVFFCPRLDTLLQLKTTSPDGINIRQYCATFSTMPKRTEFLQKNNRKVSIFYCYLHLVFSTGTVALIIAVTQRPMVTMAGNANKQANQRCSDAVLEVTKQLYKTLNSVRNKYKFYKAFYLCSFLHGRMTSGVQSRARNL
jgi:hypothetical protein